MLFELIAHLFGDEDVKSNPGARCTHVYGDQPIGRGEIVHVHKEHDLGLKAFE